MVAGIERRKHLRVDIDHAVARMGHREFRVSNISADGLFIECPSGFDEGILAELLSRDFFFTLVETGTGNELLCSGTIVRQAIDPASGRVQGVGMTFKAVMGNPNYDEPVA